MGKNLCTYSLVFTGLFYAYRKRTNEKTSALSLGISLSRADFPWDKLKAKRK